MGQPVIAVIGGGQLARMMAPAAGELGVHLRALVEEAHSSAAQVIPDSPVGAASDEAAIRALVSGADALTFEHEHVSEDLMRQLRAEGHSVQPGPEALVFARDKIAMRERLAAAGLPCPRFAALPADPHAAARELDAFLAGEPGHTAVVKTARGGYDGKGVRVVTDAGDVADWFAAAASGGPRLLVESKVAFTRELAVLVARNPSGQIRTWPTVESVQANGVCSVVTAPAPHLAPEVDAEARAIATTIARELDVTGVLAVELFEVAASATGDGVPGDGVATVVINELAMRPHNSGHWTITGSTTSQFEQHLRAVLDLPLGETQLTAPWTVMANILGSQREALTDALTEVMAVYPHAKVNLYGKGIRPGRKLGHVNVSGSDLEQVRAQAIGAARMFTGAAGSAVGAATEGTTP